MGLADWGTPPGRWRERIRVRVGRGHALSRREPPPDPKGGTVASAPARYVVATSLIQTMEAIGGGAGRSPAGVLPWGRGGSGGWRFIRA